MPIYGEISEVIGIEATLQLYDTFKGTQLNLPKKPFNTQYIYQLIKKNYNGRNMSELSRTLDYTERRLWQIIRENEK